MAHSSTIQAYAIAVHEVERLERRLEIERAVLARHCPQVQAHLQERGPTTCALNNTDELVTLRAVDGQGIAHTVSRPNEVGR